MYVIYWLQQDHDDVEHGILAVSETLDVARQYKQRILDESAINKSYNEVITKEHSKN